MRPLSSTLERRLRRPDCTARELVEIDTITGAKIVDTPDEWNLGDSLTGIEVRADGTIRLDGTQTTLISSLAESTVGATFITDLNSVSPHTLALVSVDGRDPNSLIDQVIAHLDPDPLGTGRIVDQWVCEVFLVLTILRGLDEAPGGPLIAGDLYEVLRMAGPVYVVESGTADHEVTFNFPAPVHLGVRPNTPTGTSGEYPNPTLLIRIRAIKNDGTDATNVEWQTTNAATIGTGTELHSVEVEELLQGDANGVGRWDVVEGGMDVPLVKLGYLAFADDLVEFVATPLDAGADPVTNAEVRLLGHARVPPGTDVRFYTRNDADTGWVEYTDGQRATDLVNVTFTGAGHPRKFKVELDTNAALDVTPEVMAMGFQYITSEPMYDVAEVESVEEIVDVQTSKGRLQEIRVRGYKDGAHDFNSAIEEIMATNDIADLSISVYLGHPDDDRSTWMLKNIYPIIDDIESDGHSHVLIGVCPLAFLRGGPTGERRLPRYDTGTGEREELVYSAAAALNAPSEIWEDLISVQLGVPDRWVGAPPDDVTLTYLDEAVPPVSQTLNLATQTAMKKRIADSDGHEEVDAVSHIAGFCTTSTRGKIRAVRLRGGEGPIRAIFSADDISWVSVTPGFRYRTPVRFTEYNFWDSPDDPDEIRSFHQNAIDNLGGGRVQSIEHTPEIVGSWMTSKALAQAYAAREIAAFGPGIMEWGFESIWPYPELEIGDRIAVEVDRFAAKDPNVARELRGALWAVGRIVGVHNVWGTRFTLWIENWADIIASAEVVTRIGLDELARVKAYRGTDQTFSNKNIGQTILFDTELVDFPGMHASGVVTIPAGWGGSYSIEASLDLDLGGAVGVGEFVLLAGGSARHRWDATYHSGTIVIEFAEPHVELVVGDTILIQYNGDTANSGNTITVKGGTEAKSHLSVRRVPPIRAVAATPQARPPAMRLR